MVQFILTQQEVTELNNHTQFKMIIIGTDTADLCVP